VEHQHGQPEWRPRRERERGEAECGQRGAGHHQPPSRAEPAVQRAVAERAEIVGDHQTQQHEARLLPVEPVHVLNIGAGPQPADAGKWRDGTHAHDQERAQAAVGENRTQPAQVLEQALGAMRARDLAIWRIAHRGEDERGGEQREQRNRAKGRRPAKPLQGEGEGGRPEQPAKQARRGNGARRDRSEALARCPAHGEQHDCRDHPAEARADQETAKREAGPARGIGEEQGAGERDHGQRSCRAPGAETVEGQTHRQLGERRRERHAADHDADLGAPEPKGSIELARDHAAAGTVQLGDDQERAGDGEHTDHGAGRLPVGTAAVDHRGARRAQSSRAGSGDQQLRLSVPISAARLPRAAVGRSAP
jgi:hypothetical protein